MNISVVIPLLNEQDSLTELHDWIAKVMQSNQFSYEIIFIDDGSTDDSWKIISQLATKNIHVKGIRFLKKFWKIASTYMLVLKKLHGDVIITMDADLQDSPDEIPELYNMIIKEGLRFSIWMEKETLRLGYF